MIRLNTLRKKLLVWMLVPLLVLYATRATYTYFRSIELSNHAYDRDLHSLAVALAQQIKFDHDKAIVDLPPAVYNILTADEYDTYYFTVRDTHGGIIAGNVDIPAPAKESTANDNHVFYDGYVQNRKVRIIAMKYPWNPDPGVQPVLVEVAETLNSRHVLGEEIFVSSLITQMLVISLAIMVIWFVVKRGLNPLHKLQQDVASRSHMDLSPVTAKDAPAEVQPLIDAINDLMHRLNTMMESQNRFIADAAHQLRTPLAGLKAQISIAMRQDNVVDIKAHVEKLYISIDRIARLVSQLLSLMRSEHGADKTLRVNNVDLGKLASSTVMEWVPEALKVNIDLGFEGMAKDVTILGDASRLREMIDNLIDNAIRYTPPGGRVTVRVTNSVHPSLIVEDNGDGIPPDEQGLVFERFYRILGSRSDGSGLGLAIVKEIVHAHGGNVRLGGNPKGKGTVITVTF